MPHTNPADRAATDVRALELVFWSPLVAAAFFRVLRRVSPRVIQEAIRRGSILPIVRSPLWRAAAELALAKTDPIIQRVTRFGLRSGLREVPGTRLGPQVADLAAELGAPRAVALVQAVDSKTRRTLSALIRGASRTYSLDPSLQTLRELTAEIRPLIGLTPKQASQVRRKWRALRREDVPEAAIRGSIETQAEGMIARRAAQIGDRGVIEAVSAARHEAWIAARAAGELPVDVLKQWVDQGDEQVRQPHREQSGMGPIPFDVPYPVFGVLHPPAPVFGCRCWEVLVGAPAAARVFGTAPTF